MRVIVLALLFVAGCASSPEPIVLEWHGSDEGLARAQEAADEWMSVCHAAIVVGRDNGGTLLVEEMTQEPGKLGETLRESDGTLEGMFIWGGGKDERTTIAHEFGHALGAPHAASGLMAPIGVRGPGLFHVTQTECALLK